MSAKLSSSLSLLTAGIMSSWALTLAVWPQRSAQADRDTASSQSAPEIGLTGAARFAAPASFGQAIWAPAKRHRSADRLSLNRLVATISVTPSQPSREHSPIARQRITEPVAASPADRIAPFAVAESIARPRLVTPVVVPMPRRVRRSDVAHALRLPLHQTRTSLTPITSAPFPYEGQVPGTGAAFRNASVDGRPAHRTGSGRLYLVDETYSDNRSLLHLPRGFNVNEPGVIVLYFHGHGATLERDVWRRQRLPEQISMSGVNAVLVAPQFAVDARDSSIGRFWRPAALRRYLDETAAELARLYGDPMAEAAFARMPVIIVGYSGGYLPAAWGLAHGGVRDRVRGVVLLDALYGYRSTFQKFIEQRRNAFFVSAYGGSTRNGNTALKASLETAGLPVSTTMPPVLDSGTLAVIEATNRHRDYVTDAWAPYPVADVLQRVRGLALIRNEDRYAGRR